MPLELRLNNIIFPNIPNDFGRERTVRSLLMPKISGILEDISYDLMTLMSNIAIGSVVDLSSEILLPLKRFFENVQQLPEIDIKKILQQQIRFIALVLYNRRENLTGDQGDLNFLLKEITAIIGHVPVLNDKIVLPTVDCLPLQFERSIIDWKSKPYESPSRNSRTEPVDFFKRQDGLGRISSVRRHLIAMEMNTNEHNEAISYADADFYKLGDLQADHFQPSEQILLRQKEMVMAMNIDPIFRQQMGNHPANEGYFFTNRSGQIVGTKYFYLAYHNCVDNLWLISTAANTGTGKGSEDPISWLEKHPRFGEDFFASFGGQATIDQSSIFYTVPDLTGGKALLAAHAKDWFHLQYKEELAGTGFIREGITKPTKQKLESTTREELSGRGKRRRVELMAKMALSKIIMEDTDTDSSQSGPASSPATSDAEVGGRNLTRVETVARRRKTKALSLASSVADEYLDASKHSKQLGRK